MKNHTGQNVFIIEGPCCSWACCQDLDFKVKGSCTYHVITDRGWGISPNDYSIPHGSDIKVMTVDRKKEVGKITKNWRGIGTEFLTDADTFSLT